MPQGSAPDRLVVESRLDMAMYRELLRLLRRRFGYGWPQRVLLFALGAGLGVAAIGGALWLDAHTVWLWRDVEHPLARSWIARLFDGYGAYRPAVVLILLSVGVSWFAMTLAQRAMSARFRGRERAAQLLTSGARLTATPEGIEIAGDGFLTRYEWRVVARVVHGRTAVWVLTGAGALPFANDQLGADPAIWAERLERWRVEGSAA